MTGTDRRPDREPARHFETNLAALATHSPEVAERLRSVEPRADVVFSPSAAGALTARAGQTRLHSTYDPEREARRLVAGVVSADTTVCVILGIGLGYHAQELQSSHPDLPLAIVEPDLPLLAAVLRARDLAALLASPELRLLLAATPEEVAAAVEALPLANVAIVAPASIRALDPEYYRRVEAAVNAAADRKQINVNTLARFGRLWVRNLLRNVGSLVSSPGVSALAGRFQGIPALVVAAGPSLDSVEPLLRELHRRVVIFAVDSSLGTCLRQGLDPDFVVTVDPQYWNTRYFDRLRAPSSMLICEPSTHPSSLRRLGLPTFFTSSLFPLGKLVESITGEKGRVGAGGSVATSAWDVARLLGCSPIYLAGLDLGFPDRRTHARGMYFEELMVTAATRTSPAETRSFRYLTEAGSLRVPATDGGRTLTDRRMLVYKWWFERQLAHPSAPATLTLGPRGVRIEGMRHVSPESLLELPVARAAIAPVCDAVREQRPAVAATERARAAVVEALGVLSDDLAAVAECAGEGLRQTESLEGDLEAGRSGAVGARIRSLEAIDAKILTRASREMAGFLMQPLINDIVGSRGAADAVKSSRRLYRELEESAALHAALVRDALAALRDT